MPVGAYKKWVKNITKKAAFKHLTALKETNSKVRKN